MRHITGQGHSVGPIFGLYQHTERAWRAADIILRYRYASLIKSLEALPKLIYQLRCSYLPLIVWDDIDNYLCLIIGTGRVIREVFKVGAKRACDQAVGLISGCLCS